MLPKEETVHFAWQAPEYEHHEKTRWWVVGFVVVVAVVTLYEIYQEDWFGAVTMAIVLAACAWIAHRRPETVEYQLTDKGLNLAQHHFPYHMIKVFWIVDHEHHQTLNFRTHHIWHNTLVIPLPDHEELDRDVLHAFLSEILPQDEHGEPTWSQKISRRLKL